MSISFSQNSMDLRERFFSLLDSLSALRALTQINLETMSEKALITQALRELVRYQNVDHCSVFCLKGEHLRCVAGMSVEENHAAIKRLPQNSEQRQGMAFKPGEGIVGIAYQSGQLQYCRDCSLSHEFVVPPASGGDRPGSLISTPIKMGQQVLGVLNASHPLPEYFEPWQQHALNLFGSCLGQILYNHKMLNDLEDTVQQRSAELGAALKRADEWHQRHEWLSLIDELTGLNNRAFFFQEAEALISNTISQQHHCSLLLVNMDRFKHINHRWGHQVGDQVLVAIAKVLDDEIHKGDLAPISHTQTTATAQEDALNSCDSLKVFNLVSTISAHPSVMKTAHHTPLNRLATIGHEKKYTLVARVGGAEFAILLPGIGIEDADLMAQRIQERFQQLEMSQESMDKITASIGISTLSHHNDCDFACGTLVDQLLSQADNAIQACKERGGDRCLCVQSKPR
jgi:GGDEF domain-containing protein